MWNTVRQKNKMYYESIGQHPQYVIRLRKGKEVKYVGDRTNFTLYPTDALKYSRFGNAKDKARQIKSVCREYAVDYVPVEKVERLSWRIKNRKARNV